uniref:Uncharacterized protein n=1 Tax=Romanomermis culicivorax TaxID=13658 RepID=A0A915K739_ROMCU
MAGTEMASAELGGAKMAALKCRRQKIEKYKVPRLFGQHHSTISSYSRLCPSKKGKKRSV